MPVETGTASRDYSESILTAGSSRGTVVKFSVTKWQKSATVNTELQNQFDMDFIILLYTEIPHRETKLNEL